VEGWWREGGGGGRKRERRGRENGDGRTEGKDFPFSFRYWTGKRLLCAKKKRGESRRVSTAFKKKKSSKKKVRFGSLKARGTPQKGFGKALSMGEKGSQGKEHQP